MISALPSLIKTYDEYYSGDPAFVQLSPNASEEELKQYIARRKVARETGDWSGLLAPGGGKPTKFKLRPLTADLEGALNDYRVSSSGVAMDSTVTLLTVRAALIAVIGFANPENGMDFIVQRDVDPRFPALGTIATPEVVNALWQVRDAADRQVGPLIVSELCQTILMRSNGGLYPKS